MSANTIIIEAVRPLRWDGETVRPGHTLRLSPIEAQQALDTGRARLVHADDAVACIAAVRAEIRQALRAERAEWQPPAAVPPWQRH